VRAACGRGFIFIFLVFISTLALVRSLRHTFFVISGCYFGQLLSDTKFAFEVIQPY
jgi:hypothetical protein